MRCIYALVSAFFSLMATAVLPTAHAAESTNVWYLRGPAGGYANQVAIDPVSQRPLAGGVSGVFRYDISTAVWDYANTGAPTPFVAATATTPTATFVNSGGYVARSTDGGSTWLNLSSGPVVGGQLRSIATTPAAPLRVFAAGNPMGLALSNDLGVTWTSVIPAGQIEVLRVSPTNPNLWFIGPNAAAADNPGAGVLFRTPDAGVNFTAIESGGSQNHPMQFVDIAQDPSNASHIIAMAAPTAEAFTDKSTGGEVWISHDAGQTWAGPNTNNFMIAPENSGGGEPRALLFDRFTPGVVYFATTWGVFKAAGDNVPVLSSSGMLQMGSRDSGAQPYDEVDAVAQANDGTLYAATTSGGIYMSTNSALSWTAINAGYSGLNVRIFAFQPGNTGVVLAGSADPSNTGAVYRSTDHGATWVRSSSGMNAGAIRGLAFSPSDPNLALAGGFKQSDVGGESSKGLWRSTNAGQNWSKVSDAGLRFNPIRIVVFDPIDGNKVLAASALRLNLSANGGLNWINSQDSPASFGGLAVRQQSQPDLAWPGRRHKIRRGHAFLPERSQHAAAGLTITHRVPEYAQPAMQGRRLLQR